MIKLTLFNHRDFDRLTYFSSVEKLDHHAAYRSMEKSFLKPNEIPRDKKELKLFIDNKLSDLYGPDAFEKSFTATVKKYMTGTGADRIITQAKARYSEKYYAWRTRLAKKLSKGLVDRNEVINGIKEAFYANLSTVINQSQRVNQVDLLSAEINNEKTTINRWRVLNFVHALNEKYLNADLGTTKPNERNKYNDLKGRFSEGMKTYAVRQARFIEQSDQTKEEKQAALRKLAIKIEGRYKNLANNDGVIDFSELRTLNKEAQKMIEASDLIKTSKSIDEIVSTLKGHEVLKRGTWQKAARLATNELIKNARYNGTYKGLIVMMQKFTGEKKLDKNRAVALAKYHSTKQARLGIKEGITFIHQLNKAINGDRADILKMDEVSPASIKVLVAKERRQLLDGLTYAKGDTKLVIQFLRADSGTRLKMLQREIRLQDQYKRTGETPSNSLFIAIANIDKHYKRIYSQRYRKSIPPKVGDLVTSKNLSKPTTHDKAARLLAIINLTKEAKWIIKNYDARKALKGIGSTLDNVEPNSKAPEPDLLFKDANRKYGHYYVSRAARNGLTGKELLLTTGKVVAGLTIFMNYMNFRKELGWVEGAATMATNPYAIGAAGVIYGINRYRDNQKVNTYFQETGGGKLRLNAHYALNGLTRKIRKEKVTSFVNNKNEFNVIHALMKKSQSGKTKINQLIKRASKRASKNHEKPKITREDLKEMIYAATGKETLYHLLPAKGNDQMRYLFYSTFLTTNRNTLQLERHAKDWTSGKN